jgi:dipeptidase
MNRLLALLLACCCALSAGACTTIIAGKNATDNGAVLVARTEDGRLGNHPVYYLRHPARQQGYVFVSARNPRFSYPMPDHLLSYSGMPDFDGQNRSYEEAGFNSVGVAMSATETIYSSARALHVDPYVPGGVSESEVTSIVLPQIRSARAGVVLLGQIIQTRGATEGMGIALADKHEAWYLENGGGHQWVAVRIPDDAYFVSANQGRIHQVDLGDQQNVMAAPGIAGFARDSGLLPQSSDTRFDFFRAFSKDSADDASYNYRRVWTLQQLFTPSRPSHSDVDGDAPMFLRPDRALSVSAVESALQNHYQGQGDQYDPYLSPVPLTRYRPISVFRAQEAHVQMVRDHLPAPIANIEYIELGMTALGIYVPFYQGAAIPAAYQTGGASADNVSAWWRFRKLQVLVMQNYPKYAPQVQAAYARLNQQIELRQQAFEAAYLREYARSPRRAQQMLDGFTRQTVEQVFALTDQLSNAVMSQLAVDTSVIWQYAGG